MTINEYFDQVYLINLDERPDRLQSADKELSKFDIKYKRAKAIKPNFNQINPIKYSAFESQNIKYIAGAYGCKLSHVSCIVDAAKNNYDKVLIMEDDIKICPEFQDIFDNAVKLMEYIDPKWHMIYLGARYMWGGTNSITKERWWQEYVGENLLKIKGSIKTTAYGISKRMYKYVLKNALDSPREIDSFYYELQYKKMFNCYGMLPPIIEETDFSSDIS